MLAYACTTADLVVLVAMVVAAVVLQVLVLDSQPAWLDAT